jgi:hexosaminidase
LEDRVIDARKLLRRTRALEMKFLAGGVMCLALAHAMNLMPLPAHSTPGQGSLAINQSFRMVIAGYTEPRLVSAVDRARRILSRQTGSPAIPASLQDENGAALVIQCEHASEPVQKLAEDESYQLIVDLSGARLSAPNPLGVLRGLETFLQLVEAGPAGFSAPAIAIQDQPRFPWRGLMMDVSRHWMPVEVIERNLEAMAAVKLNVLHWHLTDDQGFRIESKLFPKLQGMGSDGQFYTQDEVREIVAFARDRGIRVVPEFDIPGHSTSWLAGYPEFAAAAGPFRIERRFGVFDPTLDPSKEAVYEFLDKFIGEMAALFPDEFFHIGGDEVTGKEWRQNPSVQAFMREHGLQSNAELQAYFNKRVQAIVAGHGKRMEGWDEILNPALPKDILIQSWRGQKSLGEAARQGYQGILSTGYYIDLIEPAAKHYSVDPLGGEADSLSTEEKKRVLGGEACMWAEYVGPETVDSRIWPRTAAIAERFWSPAGTTGIESMYVRMEAVSRSLDWRGLTHRSNYEKMLERLAGGGAVEPLEILADVVEPVKGYRRGHGAARPTQQTPLNRLVDAARCESLRARQFAHLVDVADHKRTREWLVRWRENDANLQPILVKSFLLAEATPLSQQLRLLAEAGLAALDLMESGKRPAPGWLKRERAVLEEAKKARADVLLMIVPAVEKLVARAALDTH